MKSSMILASLLLVTGSAFAQSQVKLGEVSFGGTACQVDPSDTVTAVIQNGRLQIPLTSTVKKPVGQAIGRGACSFSLPLQLPQGYRLVLRDTSVIGNVNLATGTKSRVSFEVFQAGSQNPPLVSEDSASRQRLNKQINLRRSGEVLVSECGAKMILRGNASVVLQGEGRSSGSLYYVHTKARLEQCN